MNIRGLHLLLIIVSACALSGCAMVAADIRDASEKGTGIPKDTRVMGDGFSVKSPEPGLIVHRNEQRHGFLCLRSPTWEMYFGGGSYNVFPYASNVSAPTLRDAWTMIAFSEGSDEIRANYHISSEHTGTWRGQAAYFQSAYSQQSPNGGGAMIVSCFIHRGSKYYWISRSISLGDNRPETLRLMRQRAEKEFPLFLNGVIFESPSAS